MIIDGVVHCLFEQSGTFKNEFIKLGIKAFDYDIQNDFGETDYQIDVFTEIENAYDGQASIFDNIDISDLVLAFFPCTRFESGIPLNFRGEASQMKGWNDLNKLENSMQLHEELHRLYILICKLFSISLKGGWRMVVENPYTQPHYLTSYFPIKPSLIIKDRHAEGDYYKKPTQFWFINCEPEQNIVFSPIKSVPLMTISNCSYRIDSDISRQVMRSMMHPQFADRFIKSYILTKDDHLWQ